jgi:hypothetical protein
MEPLAHIVVSFWVNFELTSSQLGVSPPPYPPII